MDCLINVNRVQLLNDVQSYFGMTNRPLAKRKHRIKEKKKCDALKFARTVNVEWIIILRKIHPNCNIL